MRYALPELGSHHKARAKRVGKFGAVGILNTLIDFALFNVAGKFLHLAVVPSNIFSTTIAMIFSFAANRQLVFKGHSGKMWHQAALFIVTTAVGMYVIQTGVIFLLVHIWPEPLIAATRMVRGLGISVFTDEFYIRNGAKAIATIFSLMWNYLLYRKVVFR